MIPSKLRVLAPLSTWPQGSVLAKYDAHLGDLPDQLRQWCDEEGIEMLDLTGALICSAEGGHIPWFSGDTHWNAKGHEIAAQALVAWTAVRQWATQRLENPVK